jgi:hypothetical protein
VATITASTEALILLGSCGLLLLMVTFFVGCCTDLDETPGPGIVVGLLTVAALLGIAYAVAVMLAQQIGVS